MLVGKNVTGTKFAQSFIKNKCDLMFAKRYICYLFLLSKHKMMSFRGQASWAKMMSPKGQATSTNMPLKQKSKQS
jgi:hypothetical protein